MPRKGAVRPRQILPDPVYNNILAQRFINRLMIEAAHNDYAARSMKLLQGLSRRFWYMHYREAADLPLCARLHANQARAIAQGNGEAAARASDKLMDYVENFTRGTVMV